MTNGRRFCKKCFTRQDTFSLNRPTVVRDPFPVLDSPGPNCSVYLALSAGTTARSAQNLCSRLARSKLAARISLRQMQAIRAMCFVHCRALNNNTEAVSAMCSIFCFSCTTIANHLRQTGFPGTPSVGTMPYLFDLFEHTSLERRTHTHLRHALYPAGGFSVGARRHFPPDDDFA